MGKTEVPAAVSIAFNKKVVQFNKEFPGTLEGLKDIIAFHGGNLETEIDAMLQNRAAEKERMRMRKYKHISKDQL